MLNNPCNRISEQKKHETKNNRKKEILGAKSTVG